MEFVEKKSGWKGPERILVVDDEDAIRRVLETALRTEGYRVTTAENGTRAWDELRGQSSSDPYNLALVDIRLPDLNGLELVARLQNLSPRPEAILMTGHGSVETAIEAIKLGAFSYAIKPIHMDELYQIVRQALEKQRLLRENRRLLQELQESNRRLAELNRTLEKRVRERTGELEESRTELQRRARELATINEITNAIASSLNLNEILGLVVRETKKLVAFDRASISLAWGSDAVNEVYFLEPGENRQRETGRTFPIKGTGISWVLKNKRALIRDDLSEAHDYLEDEFIRATGAKSGIVVPLVRRGQAIGTLNLGSMKIGAYDQTHEKILRQIAGQLAVAIDNANLYRRLEEYSRNLETEVTRRTESLEQSLRELRRAQDKLVQSEKLAATAKLIAGVAHEIKNPLNSMSFSTANIETIFKDCPDLAEARDLAQESVSILKSDIRRLKEMVDLFMSFARPRRQQREPADLNEITRGVVRGLRPELENKRIRLREEYSPDLPPLRLEKDEFHRSILNLLINALDSAGEDGAISVRTLSRGGAAALEVEDDGPGIPPENRDKIFDIFFTTKPKGTGLGLSQVFRTAESHRGSISFRDRAEGGTVFCLEIPLENPE